MNREQLVEQIRKKESFLCVGLDPDIKKIPDFLAENEDPIFEFNRQIIDATAPYCVAYKPNLAFFEAYGNSGYTSLEKTMEYIRKGYPNHLLIADAKRGDIGNTSSMYATAFFKKLHAHAVTVTPYMGEDSVKPFLACEGKWTIVLALTSNAGAQDFQQLPVGTNAEPLYMHVIRKCISWGNENNLMFVAGATRSEQLKEIRKLAPRHFLLVPGVGAQGGSLQQVCATGLTDEVGLLVNASRSIIYASNGTDFAERAAEKAAEMAAEMKMQLSRTINTN